MVMQASLSRHKTFNSIKGDTFVIICVKVAKSLKGVDREKSAVFKELTQSFRTYELRGQAKKKKKKKALTESKTNKYLTLSYKNYLQKA